MRGPSSRWDEIRRASDQPLDVALPSTLRERQGGRRTGGQKNEYVGRAAPAGVYNLTLRMIDVNGCETEPQMVDIYVQ